MPGKRFTRVLLPLCGRDLRVHLPRKHLLLSHSSACRKGVLAPSSDASPGSARRARGGPVSVWSKVVWRGKNAVPGEGCRVSPRKSAHGGERPAWHSPAGGQMNSHWHFRSYAKANRAGYSLREHHYQPNAMFLNDSGKKN